MENSGTIYILTSPNGKQYVGQTWNFSKRMMDHSGAGGKCRALHSAVNKYGFSSFKKEILHSEISSQEVLDELEIYEIESRKTLCPNGYNIRGGGGGGKMSDGEKESLRKSWSDEKLRQLRIESMKRAAETPERRKELIESSKKGRASPSRLIALRESMKSPCIREERSRARALEWKDEEVRTKRIEGLKRSNGSKEARLRQSEISKKMWSDSEYRSKVSSALKGKARSESAKRATGEKLSKPVICVETGVVYKSATQASLETGVCRSVITNAVNGKAKTAGGFHWKFA